MFIKISWKDLFAYGISNCEELWCLNKVHVTVHEHMRPKYAEVRTNTIFIM